MIIQVVNGYRNSDEYKEALVKNQTPDLIQFTILNACIVVASVKKQTSENKWISDTWETGAGLWCWERSKYQTKTEIYYFNDSLLTEE